VVAHVETTGALPDRASSVQIPDGWLADFVNRQPLGAVGAVICGVVVVVAIAAPWLMPHDPYLIDSRVRLLPPGAPYLFGTDNLGRDVLSRVILGARTSVTVAFLAVALAQTIGGAIGVVGAYYGRWVDTLLQRVTDMVLALPTLVLALALVVISAPSIGTVITAIAFIYSFRIGRIVRSQALTVSQMDYVVAARALGARGSHIMARHVLPQCLPTMLVLASIELPGAIIVESSLSFLGVGVPAPTPTWGGMLSGEGRRFLEIAPWAALGPGLAISLTVLGFSLFGDALRDTLDPRLRTR
jgi:peptide/nickel transport system permease protein